MTFFRILRQLLSLILPITVTILVPGAILWDKIRQVVNLSFYPSVVVVTVGLLFILAGLGIIFLTVRMFIRLGRGTLAPWDPTLNLVVTGIYAHVRNPMISGVLLILLGESVLFGSIGIFAWTFVFFLVNQFYLRSLEEPGLIKRFGSEYLEYRANVPMWIPRLAPWVPTDNRTR